MGIIHRCGKAYVLDRGMGGYIYVLNHTPVRYCLSRSTGALRYMWYLLNVLLCFYARDTCAST